MKLKYVMVVLLGLLTACGGYKQLTPKPEVVALEAGYTPILNKDKSFELKKGKKYYMTFPAALKPNFYLVLKAARLEQLNSHLTRQFTKGKGDIKIAEESAANDDLLVYKLDQTVPVFTWVIEEVLAEMVLDLDYRYVPVWRYRFETKNAEFQSILARNKVSRDNYDNLGNGVNPENLRFDEILNEIRTKSGNLKAIQGELLEIEAIFPPDIKNSDDKAYLDYTGLRQELEEELRFHENYSNVLNFFKREKETRNNNTTFSESLSEFNRFFADKSRYPEHVRRAAEKAMAQRLSTVAPFYENKIRQKRDVSPLDIPVDELEKLFKESGRASDPQFQAIAKFTRAFNRNAEALAGTRKGLNDIMARTRNSSNWPSDNFYTNLVPEMDRLLSSLPSASTAQYGQLASAPCVEQLNREALSINQQVNAAQQNFDQAAALVPQINRLRSQNDYRGIIQLLKANSQIDFLVDQYANVDRLSLEQQTAEIAAAYDSKQWALAESRLRSLYEDRYFLDYPAIQSEKMQIQKDYEDKLVAAIETESRQRINTFVDANKATYSNVEALYASEAFKPVYTLTFSAGGPNMVDRYNKKVQDYLDGLKFDQFPRMAIENLYRDFTRDIRDNGVAKAKAVAIHGKYYKGSDRKIQNLVAECDPLVAKWITKPTEYRKIYLVPTNNAQQASNEYVFRLNIQIPSDAQFPVYDVNIKLPREVASAAGSQQWYEKMTMNGNILKNEGRFTITAPTSANDYECQITPLQVQKTGNNILEVRFKHNAFKVLEVNVMAQRPIIKKN